MSIKTNVMEIENLIITHNFICGICNGVNYMIKCRNCNNDICQSEKCGLHFDHIDNTTYSICTRCSDTISEKIIPLIDLCKLECLKKRIKFLKMVKN